MKTIYFFVFLSLSGAVAYGQQRSLQVDAEGRLYGTSNKQLPFWLRTNQFGTAPENHDRSPAAALQTRLGAFVPYKKPFHTKGFDWSAGAEAVWNLSTSPSLAERLDSTYYSSNLKILLPQYYVKAKWRHFELLAGRHRRVYGLIGDTLLSSGAYLVSGNALPLPRIEISTPDYWPLKFTKEIVSLNFQYAHGWFGNVPNAFVKNHYLHHLAFYLRLGKPQSRVRLYGGFMHDAQWGGYVKDLKDDNGVYSRFGHYASGWIPYSRVVLGTSTPSNWDYNSMDGGNRIGNHLGTVELGAEVRIGRSNLFFYRQSVYDDGSLYFLINITDGLNGVAWRNENASGDGFQVRRVVAEVMSTMSQGGPVYTPSNLRLRGADDYFNHGQYRDGWAYQGHIIGTPFISLWKDINQEVALKNTYTVANNRVTAFYLGAQGQLKKGLLFETRHSFSKNVGRYNDSIYVDSFTFKEPVFQYSGLAKVSGVMAKGPLRGCTLSASLALDAGRLFPARVGGYVGVAYRFGYRLPGRPQPSTSRARLTPARPLNSPR